jgi:hypothetical protein
MSGMECEQREITSLVVTVCVKTFAGNNFNMFELQQLFPDPALFTHDGAGAIQLIFVAGVYGYILFFASNLISDGSEVTFLRLFWFFSTRKCQLRF